MAVVGERRIYLSHLPMFMSPHNAQVILEATFSRNGKSVDDVYLADRAANRSIRFYTLTPEDFALRELFEGMPPPRTQFTATVFRGHLEKGGTPIDLLTDVDVRIKRVVHAHTFDGMEKLPTLTHILFGGDDDLLLAHFVSKAPDFDQILSVTATGDVPTADELRHGPSVEVLERANQAESRLKVGETVVARGHVTGAHQFLNVNLSVRAELYFEEGELASTRMSKKLFQQTEKEKKAGFV